MRQMLASLAVMLLLFQCAQASGGKIFGGGATGGGGGGGGGGPAPAPAPAPAPVPPSTDPTKPPLKYGPSNIILTQYGSPVPVVFGVQEQASVNLYIDKMVQFTQGNQPAQPPAFQVTRQDPSTLVTVTDTVTPGSTVPYLKYDMTLTGTKTVAYSNNFAYSFNYDYVDSTGAITSQPITTSASVVTFGFAEQVVFNSNPIYDTAQGGWVFDGYSTYADTRFDSALGYFKPYVNCSLLGTDGITPVDQIGILALPMDATTLASLKPKQGAQASPFNTAAAAPYQTQWVSSSLSPVPYNGQVIQCVTNFGGVVTNKVACKTGCVAAPTGRRMLRA